MENVGIGPLAGAGWPVWGHIAAVESLQRAVRSNRISHAYAIAGPAGVGKRTLAQVFAQALCCPTDRADPALPCGACPSCRRIGRGTHPDVQTVSLRTQAATAEKSGSKNTSLTIDTVRSLRASAALRPMEATRRVLIVDDAETLQETAQEALLKTLEEPPAAVTIVLLANDAEALLPTMRSRCQAIELHPVGSAEIAAGLVASGMDGGMARELAVLAAGRPGWAVRAAADPTVRDRQADAVARALTWIESGPYERLVTAIRTGDGFAKKRDEVFADLEAVLGVWRDVMLVAGGATIHATHLPQLSRIEAIVSTVALAGASGALASTRRCIADLEANVRPRLAIEGMVLAWPITLHPG